MKQIIYNKLVRDKIPEIICAQGNTCETAVLEDEEYIRMLEAKLSEELGEYQESKSLEELADLLEVMEAVVAARGWTWEQLTKIKEAKRAKRGGFEEKRFLLSVTEKNA